MYEFFLGRNSSISRDRVSRTLEFSSSRVHGGTRRFSCNNVIALSRGPRASRVWSLFLSLSLSLCPVRACCYGISNLNVAEQRIGKDAERRALLAFKAVFTPGRWAEKKFCHSLSLSLKRTNERKKETKKETQRAATEKKNSLELVLSRFSRLPSPRIRFPPVDRQQGSTIPYDFSLSLSLSLFICLHRFEASSFSSIV